MHGPTVLTTMHGPTVLTPRPHARTSHLTSIARSLAESDQAASDHAPRDRANALDVPAKRDIPLHSSVRISVSCADLKRPLLLDLDHDDSKVIKSWDQALPNQNNNHEPSGLARDEKSLIGLMALAFFPSQTSNCNRKDSLYRLLQHGLALPDPGDHSTW